MDKIFFNFTLPHTLSDQVPDWIQLTPTGEFAAIDGRGPFVADEAAILAAFATTRRKLAIDINHAIDLKGTAGEPSPAVGWIVELQSRFDGIWGRVEWTEIGKNALLHKEYGAISPVLVARGEHPARVVEIARASLCNDPALPQLKSLFNRNGERPMEKELLAALSLPEGADAKAVLAAVKVLQEENIAHVSLMGRLYEMAGLDSQADGDKVVATFKEKLTASGSDTRDADGEKGEMESQIAALNAKLVDITHTHAREKAERFVTKAIEQFQIVPSLREHFINRHINDAEAVEKEIAAMPALMSAGLKDYRPDEAQDGLSADERRLCHLMGVDVTKFAKTKGKSRGVEG